MILVITGPKGAGKSSSLFKAAELFRKNGKSVGGIISPRIWKNGERDGYDLINLTNGSKCVLATETEGLLKDTFRYCTFFFSNDAVAAGNRAILDGLSADVLIVDEIGNMEISGLGWGQNMPAVAGRTQPVVLSVREDVVDKLRETWGINADKIIHVLPGEDVSGKITQAIECLNG